MVWPSWSKPPATEIRGNVALGGVITNAALTLPGTITWAAGSLYGAAPLNVMSYFSYGSIVRL